MQFNRLSLWLLIAVSRGCVALPYRWQMRAGRWVGRRAVRWLHSRRKVTATNLRLCFPDRSEADRKQLVKRAFESVGMTLPEIMIAWLMPRRRFDRLRFEHHGMEHLEAALATGRGVLVCCAHFAGGEIIARHFGSTRRLSGVVYEHRDGVFDAYRRRKAATYLARTITHLDFKGMIRSLRDGELLWYLPDQDLGVGERVPSSFLEVPIEALAAPVKLARAGRALIMPCFCNRLPDGRGYEVRVHPAYEPEGDVGAVVRRWYGLLEEHVRSHEAQYLWTHKMFKTRPEGEPPVYD